MNNLIPALARYESLLAPHYHNIPNGRYVNLITIRKTESETIFRTEGSGEGLVTETVIAGVRHPERIRRVMISKRKQTAVERRTGRELLREHNLLKLVTTKKGEEPHPCMLNTNAPCAHCIDCMLYGYAVGGGGAQKSRVMTDDAYSIAPFAQIADHRTFNATFDNGTMRNPSTGEPSHSINDDEYVKPETHFLDIETLKDVTVGELQYVIGNILRSTRYGAISSRLGRVRNTIAALIFSDTEIFSNLELTQAVYDILRGDLPELDFPLYDGKVRAAVAAATDDLIRRVPSRTPVIIAGPALDLILDETIALYREPARLDTVLKEIDAGYPA